MNEGCEEAVKDAVMFRAMWLDAEALVQGVVTAVSAPNASVEDVCRVLRDAGD